MPANQPVPTVSPPPAPGPAAEAPPAPRELSKKQDGSELPGDKKPALKEEPKEPALPKEGQVQEQPKQPTIQSTRKVIYTAELEFEVESFDASVEIIQQLKSATKGSFLATINKDKLPNGKMRGIVVLRVPPDLLNDLVGKLLKELAKKGELKNQHLFSEDVTKHYSDTESRLRAARSMEERLINIIKDGKGVIKDLLRAEKELGVWRTKIEEFEGELRYYANMVSLSTLTIKLYEKDIRTASW